MRALSWSSKATRRREMSSARDDLGDAEELATRVRTRAVMSVEVGWRSRVEMRGRAKRRARPQTSLALQLRRPLATFAPHLCRNYSIQLE